MLRYLPRRAVLHRYPIIGRFAASLRPRGYLWSIRRVHLRRAYYAGSIISFLPLMGIQLPLALVAAILLRCNFMVLGGLQLITNPLSAGPIYYLTHQLGVAVMNTFQAPADDVSVTREAEAAELGSYVAETIGEPLTSRPEPVRWTTRVRGAVVAMVVGGVIVGLGTGLVLDVIDGMLRRRHQNSLQKRESYGSS